MNNQLSPAERSLPKGYGIGGKLTRDEYLDAVIDEALLGRVIDEIHEQALEMCNADGMVSDLDIDRNEKALTDLLIEKLNDHSTQLTAYVKAGYEKLGRQTARG